MMAQVMSSPLPAGLMMESPLYCITNFSPVPHENYQLPLPTAGIWREILNTDAVAYGGSGIANDSFAVDVDTDLKRTFRVHTTRNRLARARLNRLYCPSEEMLLRLALKPE